MPLYPRRALWSAGLSMAAGLLTRPGRAAEPRAVRVGVMQSGTVQWELDVMRRHGLGRAQNMEIVATTLAGKDAAAVALQAGAVDVILTDFIWVSRQRQAGAHYVFVPHSTATGSLIVRPDTGVTTLAGLTGRKIGVAGNPADKSWLLFRAYGKRFLGADPAQSMRAVFGAPPLLNELIQRDQIAAAINYWNYAARLKAIGYPELLSVRQMMDKLGLPSSVPLLGWVFPEAWAEAHPGAINGFLHAALAAEQVMATSDEEWNALRTLTRAEDDATLIALRDAYRAGIVRHDTASDQAGAEALFHLLAEIGGPAITGDHPDLAPGTFWTGTPF